MSSGTFNYILELKQNYWQEGIDKASLWELKNVQDGHDKPEGQFTDVNLLRSYLIKGLAIPLVGIKYPTISTNLLKHSNRRKVE
jgi:hypothetical protein